MITRPLFTDWLLPALSHPPRTPLRYLPDAARVSSGTGFVPSSAIRFAPYRWWREHLDDVFTLLLLVTLTVAWLIGKIEHQKTVDNLNTTLAAQQTQINDLHATLTASSQ